MDTMLSSHQTHAESDEAADIPCGLSLRSNKHFWSILLACLLMLCDAVAINTSFLIVYLWRIEDIHDSGFSFPESPFSIAMFMLLFNIIFAISMAMHGLYMLRRGASRVDEAYKVFIAISIATVLGLVVNSLLPSFQYDSIPVTAPILAFSWLMAILATIVLRFVHRSIVYHVRARGFNTKRVLIVGALGPGRAVWRTIRNAPELGYRVQGFLSDKHPVGSTVDDLPVLGRPSQLERVVRATHADEVLIALSNRSPYELIEIVTLAEDQSVSIKVYPDTFQLITDNEVSIGDLSGLPLVSVKNAALDSPINRALKRGLDMVFSSIILVCTSPMLLLLGVLIRLDSPGPTFFLQQRVGMDGKPFYMIKFRTMRTDSEAQGAGWTTPNDPRVTRLGKFLRRYSIDELPQFINVLLGEMSIVGPRPEQPKWVEQFRQEIPRYMRRHKEKAGITGWAQVNGLRGDTSIEERTRYDLYYIENWSLLFDIKIIVKTAVDFITGRQENAY